MLKKIFKAIWHGMRFFAQECTDLFFTAYSLKWVLLSFLVAGYLTDGVDRLWGVVVIWTCGVIMMHFFTNHQKGFLRFGEGVFLMLLLSEPLWYIFLAYSLNKPLFQMFFMVAAVIRSFFIFRSAKQDVLYFFKGKNNDLHKS